MPVTNRSFLNAADQKLRDAQLGIKSARIDPIRALRLFLGLLMRASCAYEKRRAFGAAAAQLRSMKTFFVSV